MSDKKIIEKTLKILKRNLEKTLKDDINRFLKVQKKVKKEISSGVRKTKGFIV